MLILLLACSTEPAPAPAPTPTPAAPALDPIRLGWQTTWATQGQLTAILARTDALKREGFEVELKPFPYGGPLNEGALAGAVDVLFTADQPALMLHNKSNTWDIAGRLMYNRVGTLVPGEGGAANMAGLRGKLLAVPFGAAAQREAYAAASAAGLDPKQDLQVKNLGIEEIVSLTTAGASGGRWGEVDAVAVWDPTLSQLELQGARVVAEGRVTAVVMMNEAYIAAHPDADRRFMRALDAAWGTWRADPSGPDAWFQELAKVNFPDGVLARAASVEPNLIPDSPVRTTLSEDDVAGLKKVATFMLENGLLKTAVDVDAALRPGAR